MHLIERFTQEHVDCFKAWAIELVKKHGASWGEVNGPIVRFAKAVKERDDEAYGDAIEEMDQIEQRHIPCD